MMRQRCTLTISYAAAACQDSSRPRGASQWNNATNGPPCAQGYKGRRLAAPDGADVAPAAVVAVHLLEFVDKRCQRVGVELL